VQDSQPMKASELGRYVCVPSGSCLHRGLDRRGSMIDANGVWVRSPDPLNPGSYLYSSAHRDCYERRQASAKAAVSQPVLNEERAALAEGTVRGHEQASAEAEKLLDLAAAPGVDPASALAMLRAWCADGAARTRERAGQAEHHAAFAAEVMAGLQAERESTATTTEQENRS
jgi:hypothetical protein